MRFLIFLLWLLLILRFGAPGAPRPAPLPATGPRRREWAAALVLAGRVFAVKVQVLL